ncbi:hypothetical protein SAMN05428959_107156 [Duganella sp. CF517]|uniref:hypothetical protein n=1 Tax=Duganella sp. CF517 TaxID=1881038 RepID=UPI0008CCED01|nr:hypothetical protein [Duganella sp. CF517]SEO39060.1 hypothetical protein SAMN05428959_107156 [Duganella sp. CF517]
MKSLATLVLAMAGGAAAGQTLTVHYSERAGVHYTTPQGRLAGEAARPVTEALDAAGIAYEIRPTPAKQQLVLLKENREPACMMSWVELPGRDDKGKFSDVIYRDTSERRLWCSKVVPDDVIERFNAALARQAK